MRPAPSLLVLLILLTPCAARAQVQAEIAFPNLTFNAPVDLKYADDGSDRLYVVEQGGVIRVFENDPAVAEASIFLDIRDRVSAGGEMGLLGVAFHPDYADNGYLFVNYTADDPRRSVIARFSRSAADPTTADPDSERVLLTVAQPFSNHNGGHIAFGLDGHLYTSLGDGGSGGDPEENGQDRTVLLGKILRLDVDGGGSVPDCGGTAAPYTVPDNALADGPGGDCDEIFAYGLRNPWRFSFDRGLGTLWAGDVGQGTWEEVDVIADGDNLGWDVMEGNACYEAPDPGEPPCNDPSFTAPVWTYGHSGGRCSITGGYVYRGPSAPELAGKYVYGDYCSGEVWALTPGGGGTPVNEAVLDIGAFITSFGEDAAGELYVTAGNGRVYRIFSDSVGLEPGGTKGGVEFRLEGPNPFTGQTVLGFRGRRPGPTRVALYDVLGREVAVLFEGAAGGEDLQRLVLDATGLPAGLYVARLTAGEEAATVMLSIVR